MSKKIKNEQKKFLGETLNQYDKALNEGINQLDKKNREQNHKISSLVNSFDNEFLEKDVEGNMTTLENSKDGMVIINEIQGSTEVNYCKDGEKELILNGDIDTQGESFVTITEGVDGGLVDVSLEGNTEINLSKTKDPVLVTREFDDINCNVGKLQYTIDDVTTINDEPGKVDIDRIVGDTMVNHAVNGSEELILNAHINESGDNNITLNGVTSDGGKVDVFLEGNTLVNVSNVKDDYITPSIEDKVDQGSVISLPEVSEGLIHIDEIEGNTMVNYCTDGAKELTLNGDIDVEGTFVTTTEGVDNGLVDVMCEGNTLVNLMTAYKTESLIEYFYPNETNNVANVSMLKPNTVYTLIYTAKYQQSGDSGCLIIHMLNNGNEAIGTNQDLTESYNKYSYTFTTPSSVECFVLRANSSYFYIKECMLLEGDWTNKEIPQYFEGMKSVGQDDENGHKIEIVSSNSDESLSNKKEIPLNEPLRGLPNGVKDKIVKIGGKWYIERNCKVATVDDLNVNDGYRFDDYNTCSIVANLKTSNALINRSNPTMICNTIPHYIKHDYDAYTEYNYISLWVDNSAFFVCQIRGLSSVEEYYDYFRNNNCLFLYPLAKPTYEEIIDMELTTYLDITHISNNSIIPCNMVVKNTGYNAIIKPSTLYTVALDTNKSGTIGMNLGGAKVTTTNNVATITTPATLSDDSLRLYGKGIKSSKVRLLEGDKTNWIPSYFEGMKSSFEDKVQEDGTYKMEILSNNRNLLSHEYILNKENWVHKINYLSIGSGYSNGDGLVLVKSEPESIPNQIYYVLNLTKLLKPNTTYTLSVKNIRAIRYDDVEFDATNIWVNEVLLTSDAFKENTLSRHVFDSSTGICTITFTTPDTFDRIFWKVNFMKGWSENPFKEIRMDYIQLEEGQMTPYVPHKSNKIQFSSIEPLRGVGNYKDKFIFKDNKLMIERNCRQVNMSELNFAGDTSNTMKCLLIHKSKPMAISNIFSNSKDFSSTTKGQMFVQERGGGLTYLWIPTDSMSREEFTRFLNEKNATIVYVMSEPTYEEVPFELQKIILEGYENGTLFFDTNIPPTKVSFNCFKEELTYLYTGTQYTVQFVSDKATTVDIILGGTQLLAQSIVVGLNRIAITTPSELVDNKLVIDGAGAKISEVVVTDTNREFRYFEGMKSVGECEELEIASNNKNLYNLTENDWINYGYFKPDGSLAQSQGYYYTPSYIDVSALRGKRVFIHLEDGGYTKVVVYDKNKSQIAFFKTGGASDIVIDLPINTNFIRMSTGGTAYRQDTNMICKEGDRTYIPHQSNTQQLTHEPLRAVGDCRDRYVLIDGKWCIERNTAEVVFDGSDDEKYDSHIYEGWVNIIVDNLYKGKATSVVCDKYICDPENSHNRRFNNTIGGVYEKYSDGTESQWIRIVTRDFSNLSNFKQYLQSNPVTVVYKLQTPQYEPIDYNPFDTYADITHISVNSSIPCNMVIKNHGYNMVALKENTQYTLYVNKDTTNALTYRLGDYVEINSLSKFTFTTPSTLIDKTLRIDGKGTKVKDLMLIEETPTNDSIGYFDGLKSSYECEQVTDENDENYGKYKVDIKVVGKNKFDGQWQKAEGVYGVYYYGKGTYTISIQEKDLSLLDNRYSLGHANLDGSNVDWLYSDGTIWRHSRTLTNGKLVFRMPTEEGLELLKRAFDIQIEEGNTATEYEPYFESKQTIYLNSPLLKGDEIVWKDNKIQHYHKMETIVFDGSDDESWSKEDTDSNGITPFYLQNNSMKKLPTYINAMLCNKLKVVAGHQTFPLDNCISGYSNVNKYPNENWIYIFIKVDTIDDLKQWLQQNPTTVVYELATPYYEEISDYPLKLNAIANSSLSTESTIQVTNISFNVYEETLPYLYSNTKYYITFNADVDRNNIIIDLGGNHIVFDCKVGFNKVEITTPSNTTNLLTFSGTGVNIDHVKVTQQDIDEYFEGMKSVGECEELEITSANSDNTLLNTQQLTHEPLRSVGEVKDRYVLIDGKWYIERNCAVATVDDIVFNGGYTFSEHNTMSFVINLRIGNKYKKNDSKIKCNTIKDSKYRCYDIYVDFDYISLWNDSTAFCVGQIRGLNTLDDVRQYFRDNNVVIIYPLETPIYEPIDHNPFEVYEDVTHISVNSTIPCNMVIKNHGYNCILKPSTTYTVALNKPNGTISAKLGGSAKVDSTNSVFTITTPSTLNDNVLRLSGSGNVKDIMILEGDKTVNTPSYFEGIESVFEQEYDTEKGKYRVTARVEGDRKESNITFYIDEPLRGTATAKDRVYIQDDKVMVERKCGSATFDGSEDENWRTYSVNVTPNSYGIVEFSLPFGILNIKQWYVGLCDKFNVRGHSNVLNKEVIGLNGYGKLIVIDILASKLIDISVDGFKQWLQQNPVTVVYELTEPIYEEADCDLSKLVLENYENSSLIFESNIPVSANIRYSGEVPVVAQAKSLSSQVDNTTLDINENIIPYMCDIDYRIVELQLMNGDTQGEGIELLGIGDIEILGNENVLFNNREDKKYNYSYDMLKRDILSQRYSKEEYQYRLDRYLLAKKISDEEYKELEGLLNNGE